MSYDVEFSFVGADMRDPDRIDRMIEVLRETWKRAPDQRLTQLLVNARGPGAPCPDFYYVEDDVIERRLRGLFLED